MDLEQYLEQKINKISDLYILSNLETECKNLRLKSRNQVSQAIQQASRNNIFSNYSTGNITNKRVIKKYSTLDMFIKA